MSSYKTIFLVCVVFCLAGLVQAGPRHHQFPVTGGDFTPPTSEPETYQYTEYSAYDYGDAPQAYGKTGSYTGEWQRLGTAWNNESDPLYVDGDTSDDGVVWSTDGGDTWGNEAVHVGDTVIFKFTVTRAAYGNHDYDQLKAWVDWNNDQVWDTDSEQVIAVQWFKNEDGITQVDDQEYARESLTRGENYNGAVLTKDFQTTEGVLITEDMLAGLWLRARVTCHDDSTFATSNATDYYWQGEIEDYFITVLPAVPVPSAILLVGTGLLGVRRMRRRLNRVA